MVQRGNGDIDGAGLIGSFIGQRRTAAWAKRALDPAGRRKLARHCANELKIRFTNNRPDNTRRPGGFAAREAVAAANTQRAAQQLIPDIAAQAAAQKGVVQFKMVHGRGRRHQKWDGRRARLCEAARKQIILGVANRMKLAACLPVVRPTDTTLSVARGIIHTRGPDCTATRCA